MIRVEVDTKTALRFTASVLRQFDFATARALNDMVYGAQARVRRGLPGKFTLRGSQRFMERLIKVTREDRATRENLAAAIRIQGPETGLGFKKGRAQALARHEFGGVHSRPVSSPFFIPSDFLRAGGGAIPRALYPANLRLAPRRTPSGILQRKERVTAKGIVQFQGKRRTFMLDPAHHKTDFWAIYQREGPERTDIQLLWLLRTKVEIQPRLDFVRDVHTEVREKWRSAWSHRFAQALGSGRRVA